MTADRSIHVRPRTFYVTLLLIITCGCGLRLRELGRASFWIDEIYSCEAVAGSLAEVFRRVPGNKPPLDYLLLRVMLRAFGETEFSARLHGCVLMTLSLGALAFLILGLLRGTALARPAALAACWLAACSPFLVRYSQEARPYALFLFCSLLALGCFVRLADPRTRRRARHWLGYGLFSLLALHTLYFGFLPLCFNLAFALWFWLAEVVRAGKSPVEPQARQAAAPVRASLRHARNLFAGTALTALLAAVTVLPRAERIQHGFTEETRSFNVRNLAEWSAQFEILGSGYNNDDFVRRRPLPAYCYFLPFALLGFIGLALIRPRAGAFCAIYFIGPVLILGISYWRRDHWIVSRYFMLPMIFYYTALGAGSVLAGVLARKFLPWFPVALPALLLGGAGAAVIVGYPSFRFDFREAARFAAEHAEPQRTALIAFNRYPDHYCVDYYHRRGRLSLPHLLIDAADTDELERQLRRYPHSFLHVTNVAEPRLSNWLPRWPQLAWQRAKYSIHYTFAPERLFEYPEVRARAARALAAGGWIELGNETYDCLGKGWSQREGNIFRQDCHRWACALESEVFFWLEQPRAVWLSFQAQPLNYENWKPQAAEILVNGESAARIAFSQDLKLYELPYPLENLRSGFNRVTFRFDHVDIVEDVAQTSGDYRELAARFEWLRFMTARPAYKRTRMFLDLDLDPKDERCLHPGDWHRAEQSGGAWFRWSAAQSARVTFNVVQTRAARLCCNVEPLVFADWPGARLTVELNGHALLQRDLAPGAQEVNAAIERSWFTYGPNELVFTIDSLRRVNEVLPESLDRRMVGALFRMIRIEPVI